jgi:REase_DpnII-MboI
MSALNSVQRLDQLIAKGEVVLRTHRPNPPGLIGFGTLDSGAFTEWRTQALACLVSLLGDGHVYVESFKANIKQGYQGTVKAGIGILKATKEDIAAGHLDKAPEQSPLLVIEQICSRFHVVARQLRSRHGDRSTLDVQDEYDAQDLMHALLHLYFVDIRPEESTPSYAGKASRMDFLLKQESIVLEIKMTRAGLGPKELSTQLIEDIERYKAHPDCQALVCFVYDPGGLIPNPRGIETDLKRDVGPFPVRVLIRPS